MKRKGFALGGVFLAPLLLFGCAVFDNLASPTTPETAQPTVVDPRTPSSLQAMQHGVASITPPGSPLPDIPFEFDSYDLIPQARNILKVNADWLRNNNGADRVEIEGHCDDLGTTEYNLALGLKRAHAAKDYLVTLGVPAERLSVISYGKEAPACMERTEECQKKNRRARFVIVTFASS